MPTVSYSNYPAWVREYAPEYPEEPKAKKGHGTKELPELKPWSYYSKYFWGFDPVSGLIYYEADGRTKLDEPIQTTDKEYRAIIDAMNFYRNGGLTPAGRKGGLDPAVLVGAAWDYSYEDETGEEAYRCKNGKLYWRHYGPTNSNNMEGVNQEYGKEGSYQNGAEYVGDLYTGEPFNPTFAGVYPDHQAGEVS